MYLASVGINKAHVGLFCESYPALLDRQIGKIQTEFPRSLGEMKRGVTVDFVLNDEYGGGSIQLRNLDDPAKYLSAEWAGIAVDELTRNPMDVFDFLRLRLRWPGVDKPRFVSASNPGGVGHGWVRKLWIDHDFPPHLKPLQDEFAFVSAKASDNPFLSASYFDDLNTLPPAMAKAYAEGSWDLFAGQYFTNFGNRHVHPMKCEPWMRRWISIDWGFDHPSAVYWHCATDANHVHTYKELVERELTPKQLVDRISWLNSGEVISAIVIDPSAKQRRDSPETIYLQLNKLLSEKHLPSCIPADNDRIGGWMLMYQMLDVETWSIDPSCTKLITCLPAMIRDAPDHVEDCRKMDGDDPADSVRYGLKWHLSQNVKPQAVIDQEHANTLSDPYAKHFFLTKRQAERDTSAVFVPQERPLWERET